jgi:signal transduction histidine kinase
MKTNFLKERVAWPALTLGLATVLIALGVLQYRWSTEVSDAATSRMRAVLSSSMLDFRQDFIREFSTLISAFPNGEHSQSADLNQYADSIHHWQAANPHAALVKAVYMVQRGPNTPARIFKFDPDRSSFDPTAWPPELAGLREAIFAQPFIVRFNGHGRSPRGLQREPQSMHKERLRLGEHRGPPWFIDASIPALLHPLEPIFFGRPSGKGPIRGIVIELDQDFFAKHLFPELTQRYFPSSDALGYDVTVAMAADQGGNLYSSNAPLVPAQADATLDLLGPAGPQRGMEFMMPHFRKGPEPVVVTAQVQGVDVPWGMPLALQAMHGPESGNWQLLVRSRRGSLEAVVADLRQRNLAISFGILIVLAATMGVLILASRRALKLAQLQMDFVAGVSHELRTPVTVISSAAENIADGVVQNQEQLARYGNAIKTQAAQLRQLIEQILLFASTRRTNTRFDLRPAAVESVIETALENTSELVRNVGFRVETSIQPGLPPVMVDVLALSQCLQNLITNAVKYGGDACWIGISAAVRQTVRGSEVLVTVADRGIGIAADELKQIFDPFFRGAEARAAQIHGNGLGLPLAKSIVEAMGGDITVESRPGSGSSFTIHLPVSRTGSDVSAVAQVNPSASYSKS